METITIVLADDHAVVRDGIRHVLEDEAPELEVIGEASDGLETLRLAETLKPRVMLIDIAMPEMNGLEVGREIKRRYPAVAVVFLTMYDSEEYFLEALRCGAEGYIPKSAPTSDVISAIRCAAHGEVYLHASVTRFLLKTVLSDVKAKKLDDPYESLTAREREILAMIANGLSNQEIGEELDLSPNTVHRHRNSLMQKLGLHSRFDLLWYCVRRGLVSPQE